MKKCFKNLIVNSSGSATITVIVTMLLVIALGAALLFGAYTSYKVAIAQRQDRENLYTAENAMDDIRAGVQNAVSAALKKAYTETLEAYAKNACDDPQKTFSEKINENLNDGFNAQRNDPANALSFYVYTKSNNTAKYSADALKTLISDTEAEYYVGANGKFDDGVKGTVEVITDETGAITELRFKQISLRWIDRGYESDISSDIVISIPSFSGSLGEYAIVAGGGIYIGRDTGLKLDASIKGDVYSGGDISVGKNSSLSLQGTTYAADDLILSGEDAEASLTGEYYGFGGSTTVPSNSSAILVNGKNARLDLRGLERLYLAGFSFINAAGMKEDERAGVENPQVLMGQSMAFKANQLAYLVPAECITNYASNPCVLRTTEAADGKTAVISPEVNVHKELWDNKTIADYGEPQIIVPQTLEGQIKIGYVFIKFNNKKLANEYFKTYFEKYPERIRQYLNFYLSLSSPTTGEIAVEGNAFYTQSGELELLPATGGGQVMGQRYTDFVKASSVSELGPGGRLTFSQGNEKVLVINGNYRYAETDDYDLVISSGDVAVNGEITGCVLAAGKVTLCSTESRTSLTAASLTKGMLSARAEENQSYQLSDFLRESYGGDGAQGENAWSSDKLVSYQNWRKN